jgi:hypothetical protein
MPICPCPCIHCTFRGARSVETSGLNEGSKWLASAKMYLPDLGMRPSHSLSNVGEATVMC